MTPIELNENFVSKELIHRFIKEWEIVKQRANDNAMDTEHETDFHFACGQESGLSYCINHLKQLLKE